MAHAKLLINLNQGLLEVDGDEEFVTKIYSDFKELISTRTPPPSTDDPSEEEEVEVQERAAAKKKAPRRRAAKAQGNGDDKGGGAKTAVSGYKPKLDKHLDLSKLSAFVKQYDVKPAKQKILLYAHFLKETVGKDPCSIDQVFSCMKEMGDRIPEAFGQAFIDARTSGLIDFTTIDDITIPITGQNFVNFKMPKAKAEAAA